MLADHGLQARAQALGPGAALLRAQQPAAQQRGLDPGDLGGEGAVGGVEQVMALVEHVAGGHQRVVQPAPARLGHDQCVVGDDELGTAGAADGVLDVAAAVVRAGAVDALSAAVGDAGDEAGAEQLGHPAGEVAAGDVAVGGGQRPAGDQRERDGDGRTGRQVGDLLLVVEQAQVVLAPLADHDPAAALVGVGEQPGQLGVDLALQVPCIGTDPDAAAVCARPTGWRARRRRGSCRCRFRPRPAPWPGRPARRGGRRRRRRRWRSRLGRGAARRRVRAWRRGGRGPRPRRPAGRRGVGAAAPPPISAGRSRPRRRAGRGGRRARPGRRGRCGPRASRPPPCGRRARRHGRCAGGCGLRRGA